MAAILGLPAEAVAEICVLASDTGDGAVVEVANYNTPEQTVISGDTPALERAMTLAKERGAKRALRLNVAAPFHSSRMRPLAEEMRRVLAETPMQSPRFPVIANVTADYVREPDAIRAALTQQVAGSVRWTETIRRLSADGVTATVEAGPGRVLTGMTPRIEKSLRAVDTAEALAGALE
jgi:[acyl-carrier-protein] S-malonyltransferase